MKYSLLVRHLILLSAGLVILALDRYVGLPTFMALTVLLLWATFKVYYFIRFSFKQIEEVEEAGWFLTFLKMMSVTMSLILVSFAVDYSTLFQLKPDAFEGVNEADELYWVLWQFLYFSVATFATVGFGDISPNSRPAEYLVVLEIILSVVAIIFVVSNSHDIKKSMQLSRENDEALQHEEEKEEKEEEQSDAGKE